MYWKLFCLILIFWSSATSIAQAAVSLRDLIQRAQSQDESILIQRSRLDQMQERVLQAKSTLLPTSSLVGAAQRIDSPGTINGKTPSSTDLHPYSLKVTATQPLFRGLKEFSQIDSAKHLSDSQQSQIDATSIALATTITQLYFNILSAENDLKNLATILEFTTQRAQELKKRMTIGRSRKSEWLNAMAQVSAVNAQIANTRASMAPWRNQLAQITGIDSNTPLIPTSGAKSTLALDEYLQRISSRPDVLSLRRQIDSAESDVNVIKAGHYPSIDLSGNYYIKRNGSNENSDWDAGLYLTLPLFEGGTRVGQVREAKAKVVEKTLALRQAENTLAQSIRAIYEALGESKNQMKQLETATQLSEQSYIEQLKDQRNGLVTIIDVLQYYSLYVDNKRALDKLRYHVYSQQATLNLAVGIEP